MDAMSTYLLLFLAIVSEVIATSFLKLSDGYTKLIPSIIVAIGYCCAFWLMSITLKTLPVGIVYAIWSGLGIVGIAIIGVIFFRETFGIWHFIGITLIVSGVFILSVMAKAH
jgi:small multidrug resistance pump